MERKTGPEFSAINEEQLSAELQPRSFHRDLRENVVDFTKGSLCVGAILVGSAAGGAVVFTIVGTTAIISGIPPAIAGLFGLAAGGLAMTGCSIPLCDVFYKNQ